MNLVKQILEKAKSKAIFHNEEDQKAARNLAWIIVAMFTTCLIVVLVNLVLNARDFRTTTVAFVGCILCATSWGLIRRGYLETGRMFTVLIGIVTVTLLGTVGQGIRDSALVGFPIVILLASLTLKRVLFRVSIGIIFLAACWLALGEAYGWFVTQPFVDPSNWFHLILVTILLVLGAFAAELLATNMRMNLEQAHKELAQRKQAEEELRETNARHSAMVCNIGDVIGIIGADGIMKYKSPNIEKWFGWKPEDLVGSDGWHTVHPDDLDTLQEAFFKLLEKDNAQDTVEYRYKCKDGTYKWTELTAVNCVKDPAIKGILLNYHDITERWCAEEALHQSESRFQSLFEKAPLGYQSLDIEGKFIEVNLTWLETLGYSREEVIGKWFADFLAPEYKEAFRTRFPIFKAQGHIHSEFYMIHKNGDRRYIVFDGRIGHNPDSSFKQTHCILKDETEKKIAEEELSKASERLKLATSSGQMGIWDWDLTNNSMVWDDRMFELYGITRATFITTIDAWTSGLHPEDKQHTLDECNAALAGTKEFRTTFRVLHPGGAIVHVKADALVIRDTDGKAIRMVGINADITQQKRMEEELQKSQKLESLGLLAGGIAHDFNNLMGGIFGYIDMASEDTKEPKVSSYLAKALTTIDRARALTQQLLTFAKGGAPIKKTERLFPFVQETAQFALSGSTVSASFQIQENLWSCNTDKNQIGQVIDNIIINAQQAMPTGGRIAVSAQNVSLTEKQHSTLAAGDYVKLSIKDQGVGIPQEFLPRIFDPFYTTKPKGHGLGLATCYSIVNRHGGCIEVESEPGKGSTFHVYLPASVNSVSAAAQESIATFRGTGTFLVVDDEEVVREVIGDMLESLGYSVILKVNGEDAVAWFTEEIKAKRTLAGMIFDLTIPGGMGGKEAIGEIRKLCLKTPVFVASGYAVDPVMSSPKDYGFSGSICKPFRKVKLVKMLGENMKVTKYS